MASKEATKGTQQEGSIVHLSRKRRLIGGAITLIVLGAVGFVYASWISGGTGSAYAEAGQARDVQTNDVSASVTTDPTKMLYPGTDGDVLIQIKNPNPYPVTVTELASDGAATASGGKNASDCNTNGTAVALKTDPATVSISVPAASTKDGTTFGISDSDAGTAGNQPTTLTNAAHMGIDSDDGCQNATFTIPVTLTAHAGS